MEKKLRDAEDDYDRAILGDIRRIGWSVIQINKDCQEVYSFFPNS